MIGDADQHVSSLRTWARLGRGTYQPSLRSDWAPALRLTEAAREKLRCEAARLQDLLEESRRILEPLEDPLDVDLGLHRWLAADREGACSDWLQWVLQRIRIPAAICQLFGLTGDTQLDRELFGQGLAFDVKRELPIEHGHEGREGRLDLVIRFGEQVLIVVEVKTVAADEAGVLKQKGYSRWLDAQPARVKRAVLLAVTPQTDPDQEDAFQFVSWTSLCVELRHVAVSFTKTEQVMVAAMILAFVAAVEQNVLGFGSSFMRDSTGNLVLFNSAVVDHLLEFCDGRTE